MLHCMIVRGHFGLLLLKRWHKVLQYNDYC